MIIDGRKIGNGEKPYLVAEISANHNGSIQLAKDTILAAKHAGADAVKIQTYTPDTITINCNNPEFVLTEGLWAGRNLYNLYEEAHTPFEWHEELFNYAHKIGITLFSTPFDSTAVDLLERLNTPAYKIASLEICDLPLIEKVAATKKTLLISTGAAAEHEIQLAIHTAISAGAKDILLFHCISAYPAPLDEINLGMIDHLRNRFGFLVGLSDHTIGTDAGFLASALGAAVIEKHFILDRKLGGPDSEFSANPEEFSLLRERVDLAKQMIGHDFTVRTKSEKQSSELRKSIYFVKNLSEDQIVTENDIKVIRPGKGIHPKYYKYILGSKVVKDVKFGDPVTFHSIEANLDPIDKKASNFTLISVDSVEAHFKLLYEMLCRRTSGISHKALPSYPEHCEFVTSHPYRAWFFLVDASDETNVLGNAYVCDNNSVGVHLDFSKISFSAQQFVDQLEAKLHPLPPRKSMVPDRYFFNVSPKNLELLHWFHSSGFVETQRSFVSNPIE